MKIKKLRIDIENIIQEIEDTIPEHVYDREATSFGLEGIYEVAEVYEEILGPYNNQ